MINSVNLNTQELLKQAQNCDNNAVAQLCQGIYNATANKWGTDEEYINTIMQNADNKTLASIMDAYSNVTGSEIYKDIESDFSGKAEKEILLTLENAYKEVNNKEYTGNNDGKLSLDQKAESIGKGLLNKVPDIALTIGGVALAKSAIGACISGVATTALTAVFGTAAATVATIAAPVLVGVGLVTAGVMIYKGVTQTAKAIKNGQNATTDDIAQNALQQGTEGVITTSLGIYEGYESIKAFGDIAKANKATKQHQQDVELEAQARIEQEQLATERAQQTQSEYNKPFEDILSNKSAQESAEVINEIYNEVDLRISNEQQIARAQKVQDELIDAMQHPTGIIPDESIFNENLIYSKNVFENMSDEDFWNVAKEFNQNEKAWEKFFTEADDETFSYFLQRESEIIYNINNEVLLQYPNISKMSEDEFFAKLPTEDGDYRGLFFGTVETSGNVLTNRYLRTGDIEDVYLRRVKNIVKSADFEFQKQILDKDTILYRSLRDTSFIPYIGETFIEQGYTSTSIFVGTTTSYGENLFEIIVPKGTNIIADNSGFAEILLDRGSVFKVIGPNKLLLVGNQKTPL